jgi:hypothetical protein
MKNSIIIILVSFIFGFTSDKKSCTHNVAIFENWNTRLDSLGYHSDSVHINKNKLQENNNEKTNLSSRLIYQNSCDYYKIKQDKVRLIENRYDNPCAAKKHFKIEVNYFSSQEPIFDKNNGSYAGILQDNIYFEIRQEKNNDSLMNNFLTTFMKALLKKSPEKHTVYIKYANKKAIVK